MSKTKKKVGRPEIELDELQIRDIELLAAYLPIGKIADYLGISEKSFHTLKERDDRIFTAYNRGVTKAHSKAGNTIMRFMQYEGDNPCELQLKFQAAKFYNQTKGGWKAKEEKKVRFNIPDDATPVEIVNKTIAEIREGNITLAEVKQLTELAQVKQQLLGVPVDEERRHIGLSDELILANIKDLNEAVRNLEKYQARNKDDKQ